MQKEKILVTGATGYLGSEVTRHLFDARYYIRAYVRKTSHTEILEDSGIELVYGDLRDAEALKKAVKGMDVVIHLGAGLQGSEKFIMDSCVKGTTNLAEAARKAKVKRVIYISSFSIYDYFHIKDGTFLTEKSRLEAQGEKRGTYSWAKRQTEDIALSNLSGDGPAWTILRPSLIFGNGRDIASLIGPRIANFLISFGRSKKHLKLIHVKDVARAIILTLENDSTINRVFNLSHEDEITVKDMYIQYVKHGCLENLHVLYVPYYAGLIGIAILKLIKLLVKRGPNMNRIRLAYLSRDVLANSDAFCKATDWCPEALLSVQLTREMK